MLQLQNFLPDTRYSPTCDDANAPHPIPAPPGREPLRVLLIGSRYGVTHTIHKLHILGFAQAGEWSPLLPAPTPGEVMSILIQQIEID